MRDGFAGVAVGVDVNRAVAVAVFVKMHAVTPQPPQYMRAEANQHDADGALQRPRELLRDGVTEHNRGACEHEQGQGMAEAPGQAVLDDIADMAAARGDAGHRGDMIGLERVLHSQQKPKPQNSEHKVPYSPRPGFIASAARPVRAKFGPECSRPNSAATGTPRRTGRAN